MRRSRNGARQQRDQRRTRHFLDVFHRIRQEYEASAPREEQAIDFHDLINQATSHIRSGNLDLVPSTTSSSTSSRTSPTAGWRWPRHWTNQIKRTSWWATTGSPSTGSPEAT